MRAKSERLRSRPIGWLIKPRTFSQIAQRGCSSPISRPISGQRSRSSSAPRCFPAWDQGWHGKPPTMMSTLPSPSVGMVRTSSKIGTSGQCLRRTAWQNWSRSQNATVRKGPADSSPRLNPPIPLKRSRTLSFFLCSSPNTIQNYIFSKFTVRPVPDRYCKASIWAAVFLQVVLAPG